MGKDLTIEELVFDDKNFNKHTEQGMTLLEKSLQELGAGRSILVDKNNNIISGNGIAEAAGRVGIKKVRVIEVQGDELVAVRRTDMELDSEKGRKMALADNATAAVDLSWDYDTLQTVADEFDIDTEEWGVEMDTINQDDFGDQFSLPDGEKGLATMNFTLANEQAEKIKEALNIARNDLTQIETFGNENSNGNALYKIVNEWAGQRK